MASSALMLPHKPMRLTSDHWTVAAASEGAADPCGIQASRQVGSDQRQRAATGPVLVVDDDQIVLEVISEALTNEGFIVEHAHNGAEALIILESIQPSLMLLDMRMPVMDGWELAAVVRQRGFDTPIVVMTAARNAEDWAVEIGAQGFLAKPFDLDELLLVVRRFGVEPTEISDTESSLD